MTGKNSNSELMNVANDSVAKFIYSQILLIKPLFFGFCPDGGLPIFETPKYSKITLVLSKRQISFEIDC